MKLRTLVVASVLVFAGCGGGGGGSAPVPQPSPVQTNTPTNNYKQTASLTLVIPLPRTPSSTKRNPQYVPGTSASLSVTVNSVNSGPPPSWVTPVTQTVVLNGSVCTTSGSVETCTINTIPAPPGTVNYTFTVSDSSSNALATLKSDETIVQGTTNSLNVTLQGIVKTVTLATPALTADLAPTGGTQSVTVTAKDADGNTITGTYNNPIALTENDATGITSLAVGGTTASPAIISNDSNIVTLAYNGQAVNNFTISAAEAASGPSGEPITGSLAISPTVNDVAFTGTTDDTTAAGGLSTNPNWGQQTVFFSSATGPAQTISASELGWTDSPFSKAFSTTPSFGCTGVATVVAGGTPNTFVVTPSGAGICSVKLSETGTGYPLTNHPANATGSETHDGTFWISVTTAGFTVK